MKENSIKTFLPSFGFALFLIFPIPIGWLAKREGISIRTYVKKFINHHFIHFFRLSFFYFSLFLQQAKKINLKHYHQRVRLVVSTKISITKVIAYFPFRILNNNTCIYSSKHSLYTLSDAFFTPTYPVGSAKVYQLFRATISEETNASVRLWLTKKTKIT